MTRLGPAPNARAGLRADVACLAGWVVAGRELQAEADLVGIQTGDRETRRWGAAGLIRVTSEAGPAASRPRPRQILVNAVPEAPTPMRRA